MVNVITAPTEYPVSLADAKAALLVDHDQDDALILRLVAAATEEAERLAGRAFVSRTVELVLDAWPCDVIRLSYPPVSAISQISYYDENNTETVVSAAVYLAILDLVPPVITLKKGQSWPTAALRDVSPIRVRYVAGYGAASAVPERYRALILGLVAVDYESREAMGTTATAQRARLQAALKLDWGWV